MSKLSKWLKHAEKSVSNAIPHQHSADRRAANEAVAQQISYYKDAKDEMAKVAKETKDEKDALKNKVAKKQIKSARHAYRAPGFMDDASTEYSDTLG